MSRLLVAQRALTVPGWAKDALWRRAQAIPSLDLRFADNKSLVDATTGSNLVTHTRASSGTFVGSDGVLRSAVTNLLLRSEEFSDAAWVQPAIVSANTEIAPNGTLTADTITSGGGANSVYQNVSVLASTIYTASVYAKLGTMSSSDYKVAVYNNSASNFIAADVTPSQTPNSSGWTRVTYTFTTPVGCTSVRWYPFRNGSAIPLSTVYLWGAQLEQSATVGEYIPTTSTINSAPRFDHDPTTGESLGLLVEESRTNLLLQSEDFSTSWTTVTATVTTNVATAPNGTTTADLYSGTSTSAVNQSVSLTSGVTYTISFYVKSAGLGNDSFRLRIDGAQTSSNFTATSEWQRFTFTATSANTGARTCGIVRNTAGDNVDVLLWGAQLEAGAFPTSYIPTVAATVTRAADVASITGSNFSSWYRQDEGTVFVNGITPPNRADFPSLNTLHDGTSNNRLLQYVFTSGYFSAARVGSVPQGDNTAAVTPTDGSAYKVASAFAVNNSVTAVNGVTGSVDTLCLMPTALNTLAIGAEWNNANIVNSTIRRLTFWPTRLSNEVLQRITQ